MGQGVNAPINALDVYHGMPQPPGPAPPPGPGRGGGETPGGVENVSGGFDLASIMQHFFGGGGGQGGGAGIGPNRDPNWNPGFHRGKYPGGAWYEGPPGSPTWKRHQLDQAPRDAAGNILTPWIQSEATPFLKQSLGRGTVASTRGDQLIRGALLGAGRAFGGRDWTFDPATNRFSDPNYPGSDFSAGVPGTAQALFDIQQRARAGRAATSPGGARLTAKERRYALTGK